MERKVIYRDRQEFQAQDINNTQDFVDESLQHVILDAITPERQIVGLQVTAKSATEIEVAPGRLWVGDSGKVYRLDTAQTISVFSYLPVTDKRYLAVSVVGEEVDTDIQPRDFLIDLQTGQTEPSAVPMERKRIITVYITSGLESPDPQKPVPPTGYTLIAYVLLNPGGIESIELATNKKLPRLFETEGRVKSLEDWQRLTQPKISTISSDIATLAQRVNELSREEINRRINELASDVARLKVLNKLPSTYSSYDQDNFLDDSKSDTQDPAYYARVEEGLSFPWEGENVAQLQLFNPYEDAVSLRYRDIGFLIPAFSDEVRLETRGYSGDILISQYQYQSFSIKQGQTPVTVIRYGPTRWVPYYVLRSRYWWHYWAYWYWRWAYGSSYSGSPPDGYEVLEDRGHWVKVRFYWKDTVSVSYQYIDTTTQNIAGSQIAQTFLNSQNGWLTKVGLFFTQKDTNGTVYITICETEKGLPNLNKAIGTTSLNPDALKLYPEETVFEFQRPLYLEAGKRYALVITTAGAHKVATVSGTEYTQGTIFYSTDGEYFQGDFTKDLMMKFYYAKFLNPRTIVELQAASLSGGIADISILAQMIVPNTCELIFEYQKDGRWYAVNNQTAEQLLGLPALLPLRAVFIGSTDLMPALNLVGSKLYVRRPASTFKHISTQRTLGASTTQIEVQLLLRDFDSTKHSLTVSLSDGTNTYNPSSVSDIQEAEGIRRKANFNLGTAISSYKIILDGSTNTPLNIFNIAERIDIAQ